MKKGFVALILVFALLFSFAACRKVDGGNDGPTEMQSEIFAVGEDGKKHDVQAGVDEEGNTQYFYIDENGNEVTVKSDEVVVEEKPVKVLEATQADGSLTPEAQSILDAFNDPSAMEGLIDSTEVAPTLAMGEEIITAPLKNQRKKPVDKDGNPLPESDKKVGSTKNTNAETTTAASSGNNGGNASGGIVNSGTPSSVDYKKILNGNKFTASFNIKTTVGGESMTLPIKIARNGDMYYLETNMPISEKGSTKCNFLLRDGTCYMILPTLRSYYSTPTAEEENLGVDEIIGAVQQGTYVSSGDIVISGKTYTCDIYESEGQQIKYYYLGNTLKRIETTMGEDTTIMEIISISTYVDSSLFKVPVGYMDMSKLMGEEPAA